MTEVFILGAFGWQTGHVYLIFTAWFWVIRYYFLRQVGKQCWFWLFFAFPSVFLSKEENSNLYVTDWVTGPNLPRPWILDVSDNGASRGFKYTWSVRLALMHLGGCNEEYALWGPLLLQPGPWTHRPNPSPQAKAQSHGCTQQTLPTHTLWAWDKAFVISHLSFQIVSST